MPITELKTDLAEKIRAETGENVFLCYQCAKCSSGCPLGEYFDLAVNQVMRAAQLGLEDMALNAKTPWLCAGCQTCTTRCPQGINVAKVMDFMVKEALARGVKPQVPEVALFNKVFLRNVNILGRAYELGLTLEMNARTGQPFKDVPMGLEMIRKRKINLMPEFARVPKKVEKREFKPNQIGYYPGCSLHSMASEYDHSLRAVSGALDLELVEAEGWVCCGSSPAHRIEPKLAVELPMKNLALIQQMGLTEVTIPCAMCFNRFRTAQSEAATEHAPLPEVAVRSFLDVLVNRIGLPAIAHRVRKPLTDLKVACYYGCLLTRPPKVTRDQHPEYPCEMDDVMKTLGATVLDWGSKTMCCGASLSATLTEIALDLSANILSDARAVGADAVVVACPLCHLNLDARQHQMKHAGKEIPVLYISQLVALAFGMDEKAAALAKNMVDPKPLLREKGLLE
ncbi:MAG: 4Fe-4S dicluster domain-containing protein [Chloroflexi bacterium]|nr:4Fe-4S dicluster domain-containing protein [Chloroflexota bacterium]